MNWTDPKSNELTEGFREKGFLPEAFINLLALLGWNDGTEKEIFTKEELIDAFSMDRVHSGGARFDYEKAKWFNHEWIKTIDASALQASVKNQLASAGITIQDDKLLHNVITLVKDRCTLLPDFVQQSSFFFQEPASLDVDAVKPKWNDAKKLFFAELIRNFEGFTVWNSHDLESNFKEIAAANQIKPGDVLMPFRVMLVGGKFGPHVFDIAWLLGKTETINRIQKALPLFG